MHIGRRYKFTEFLVWTRWEAGYLLLWSLLVTLFLQLSHWKFLTIPAPVLTIVGSALAIMLAFKNQQCYARFNDALSTFCATHLEQSNPGQQVNIDGRRSGCCEVGPATERNSIAISHG